MKILSVKILRMTHDQRYLKALALTMFLWLVTPAAVTYLAVWLLYEPAAFMLCFHRAQTTHYIWHPPAQLPIWAFQRRSMPSKWPNPTTPTTVPSILPRQSTIICMAQCIQC